MEAGKAIVIISIFVVYSVYGQKLTTEYVFYQPPPVRASNSACRCGLRATNPDGKQHSMHTCGTVWRENYVRYGMEGELWSQRLTVWSQRLTVWSDAAFTENRISAAAFPLMILSLYGGTITCQEWMDLEGLGMKVCPLSPLAGWRHQKHL